MKAIINGLRYDTETAERIAGDCGGNGRSDFRWFDEDLYRTKKGNWFLAGEGGPMTKYVRYVSGGATYGEKIIPLTPDEAREWLERNGENDCVEAFFGTDIEDA